LSSTADGPKPSSPAKESEAGEVIKKDPPIVFNIFLELKNLSLNGRFFRATPTLLLLKLP
jgi:hypothetical protein